MVPKQRADIHAVPREVEAGNDALATRIARAKGKEWSAVHRERQNFLNVVGSLGRNFGCLNMSQDSSTLRFQICQF